MDVDPVDGYIPSTLYHRKGKRDIYARQDVYVDVKLKRTAKRMPIIPQGSDNVINIKYDIWFHIAMEIAPEDFLSFALICKQTARLVNSRAFWRNLYRRYCMRAVKVTEQLQLQKVPNYDTKALRSLVIETLYQCYQPLKCRLELGYSLYWLLQRRFVSCWQIQYNCRWVMCYKFWNQKTAQEALGDEHAPDVEVVDDWESLVNAPKHHVKSTTNVAHSHEGVVILVVLSRHYVPVPMQLSYGQQQSRYRLTGTRELLCKDMRATNLELDFVEDGNGSNNVSVTVQYAPIEKYKVLPWWHPDFKSFVK